MKFLTASLFLFLTVQCSTYKASNVTKSNLVIPWRSINNESSSASSATRFAELYSRCTSDSDCKWSKSLCTKISRNVYDRLISYYTICKCPLSHPVADYKTTSCREAVATASIGNYCNEQTICSWKNSKCIYGICACSNGYPLKDYSKRECNSAQPTALPTASIDQYCNNRTKCIWGNSECVMETCVCRKGYQLKDYFSRQCKSDGGFGSYCAFNTPCTWKNSICSNSKCVCPRDKSIPDYTLKRCLPAQHNYSLGVACNWYGKCDWKNSLCDSAGQCRCRDGYTVKRRYPNECIKPSGSIFTDCYYDEDCNTDLAECINYECKCPPNKPTYSYSYDQCVSTPKPTTFYSSGALNSHCQNNYHCSPSYSECTFGFCQCPVRYPVVINGKCHKLEADGYSCTYGAECRSMVCNGGFCQSVSTGNDLIDQTQKVALGFGICIIVLLLGLSVCACMSKRRRSTRRRRWNSLSLSTSTNSNLQLLSELNEAPPRYSDVFVIGPQARRRSESKPPTYDEAMQLAGWQQVELIATGNVNPSFQSDEQTTGTTNENLQNTSNSQNTFDDSHGAIQLPEERQGTQPLNHQLK